MPTRVVISDVDNAHALAVKSAVLAGYGAGLASGDVEVRLESLANSLSYAHSVGAIAVVRSTTGLNSQISVAQSYYPTIQTFMPLGSNSFVLIDPPASIPVIVTAGASNGDNNETGYGPGLEFFDDDNGEGGGTDLSSFSNGIICGKLLRIKDLRGGSWWDARFAARMTASEGGVWDVYNGFGIINRNLAAAYNGFIINDPYVAEEPGEEDMSTVPRQMVISALLNALQSIRTVNGYYTDIGANVNVFRPEGVAVADLPIVIIRDIANEAIQETISTHIKREFNLTVEIELICAAGGASDQYMRQMLNDIEVCLDKNYTLSGTAIQVKYLGDTLDIEQEEKTVAGATVTAIIHYRRTTSIT